MVLVCNGILWSHLSQVFATWIFVVKGARINADWVTDQLIFPVFSLYTVKYS